MCYSTEEGVFWKKTSEKWAKISLCQEPMVVSLEMSIVTLCYDLYAKMNFSVTLQVTEHHRCALGELVCDLRSELGSHSNQPALTKC